MGVPGLAPRGQRRSGASVVAAWLSPSVGACGVGVLLARRCPGKRHGALPRRPRRIALRRSRLACARRLALPLGRRIAASVGAAVRPPGGVLRDVRPGAQGRGSVGMRLAARGRPGIAGVVPGSVTGLCPQSRGGDAQQPRGGERRAMQTRQNLELPKQAQYGIIGIKLQTQCNSTPQTNSDG